LLGTPFLQLISTISEEENRQDAKRGEERQDWGGIASIPNSLALFSPLGVLAVPLLWDVENRLSKSFG